MGLCSWQLGGSLRANGHWQSAEDGPQLMNGLIYQYYNNMATYSFGLLGEVGQPLKLRYQVEHNEVNSDKTDGLMILTFRL